MLYAGAWNQKKEEAVLIARKHMIWEFLEAGYNMILDDTNLDPKRMDETKRIIDDWAGSRGKEVTILLEDFTYVSLEECLRRNDKRHGIEHVPPRFIKMYYNKYIRKENS
jgi:predicted kinase